MITREHVAKKINDYLDGQISLAQLVGWAENAMMASEFDEQGHDIIADVIGRLGLADVENFALTWGDFQEFLMRLGYRARVTLTRIVA